MLQSINKKRKDNQNKHGILLVIKTNKFLNITISVYSTFIYTPLEKKLD